MRTEKAIVVMMLVALMAIVVQAVPVYDLKIVSPVDNNYFATGIAGKNMVYNGWSNGYAIGPGRQRDFGPRTSVSDVNSSGAVCGQKDLAACYWPKKGDAQKIGPVYSIAFGINSENNVVGNVMLETKWGGSVYPFLFNSRTGVLRILSKEPGTAWTINNQGTIGGNVYRSKPFSSSVPVLWKEKKRVYHQTDLPLPNGASSGYVHAIDKNGQPVGYSATGSGMRATIWQNEKEQYSALYLPDFFGENTWAMGIENDKVIGASDTAALLWENDQVYDLNSLVSGGTGCYLFAAMAISNGRIYCRGYYYATGYTVAAILTPTKAE